MTVLHVASHKNIRYARSINNKVVRNKLNEYNGTSVTTFQKPSRNSQDPSTIIIPFTVSPQPRWLQLQGN